MGRLAATRYGRFAPVCAGRRVTLGRGESAGDRLCGGRDLARGCRVVAALLGLLVMSGCSGSTPTPSSSTPTTILKASVAPSPDASTAAGAAALGAYRSFRRAQVAAEAVANARHPGLAKYAGDKALAQERANLLQLAKAGIVVTGQPILTPVFTAVSLGASPTVTIMDCVDTSGWTPIYKASGKGPRRNNAGGVGRVGQFGLSW